MWEIQVVRRRTAQMPLVRAAACVPLLLLAAACVGPGATVAPSPTPTGVESAGCDRPLDESVTHLAINVGGDLRVVSVHRPATSISSGPVPLVVAVHGIDDTAEEMARMTGLSDEADAESLVIVYPQARGDPPRWNLSGPTDVTFLERVIDTALGKLCIDTARVFAAGYFDGGSLALRLGCDDAARVAAVGTVAGLYGEPFGGTCSSGRPIPVIIFHGQRDEVVAYDGGEVTGTGDAALDGEMSDPVEDWATAWASHNGCALQPQELPASGAAAPLLWTDCDAPVELLRIANGHHDWPGGDNDCGDVCPPSDISATEMMLEFFEAHPLETH